MKQKQGLAQISSIISDYKNKLCKKFCPCNDQTLSCESAQEISDEDILKKAQERNWILLFKPEDIEWYQNNHNLSKPKDTTTTQEVSDEEVLKKVEERNWILLSNSEDIEWYQNYRHSVSVLDKNKVNTIANLLHSAITNIYQLSEDCPQKDYINNNLLKSFHLLGLKVKKYSADDVSGFIIKEDPLCNEPTMVSPVIVKEQDNEVLIRGTVFVPVK